MATLEAREAERESAFNRAKRLIEANRNEPLPPLVVGEYPPEGCDGEFLGVPCRIPAGATCLGHIELLRPEPCDCAECFIRGRRQHFVPLLTLNPHLTP